VSTSPGEGSGAGPKAPAPPISLDKLKDPAFWLSEIPTSVAVKGSSMEPFLKDGDVVEVVRTSRADLFPGQLLVFLREGTVVVHRLLVIREERFLEKGDAQPLGTWVVWPEALGLVLAITREGETERVQMDQPPWPEALRRQGARHLKVHRVHHFAVHLPGSLVRRAFLKVARTLAWI
jgi:hypothetical protein